MGDDSEAGDSSDNRHRRPRFVWWFIYKIVSEFKNYEADQKQHASQERAGNRTANATVAMAVASFAIFILGIAQYLVTNGQLGEMRAQRLMTVAQLQADLQQGNPEIDTYGPDGRPAPPDKATTWYFSPQWVNSGETDAVEYRGWFDIKPIAFSHPHKITAADCWKPAPENTQPTIIHRGEPFRILAKKVTRADAITAESGKAVILLVGHIEYRDVFPDTPPHHRDWCTAEIPNDLDRNVWANLGIWEHDD